MWVLRLGLPLLIVLGLMMYFAHKGSTRLVEPVRWYGDAQFDELNFDLSGVVRMKRLVLRPYGASESVTIEGGDIEIKTPGLFWLVSAGLASKESSPAEQRRVGAARANGGTIDPEPLALPAIDHVEIDVGKLDVSYSAWVPEDMRWMGLATAAPFESVGCGTQKEFEAEDLAAMGVPAEPLRAHASVEASGDIAHVVLRFGNAGRVHSTWDARLKLKDASRLVETDRENIEPIEQTWRVNDEGFVVARNRYCAHRLRLSRPSFVDRHVDEVVAELATHGIAPTPDMTEAYRRFTTRGGELTWHSKPASPVGLARLAAMPLEQKVAALGATMQLKGESPLRFALTAIEPSAVPAPATTVAAAPETPETPKTEPAKPSPPPAPAPEKPVAATPPPPPAVKPPAPPPATTATPATATVATKPPPPPVPAATKPAVPAPPPPAATPSPAAATPAAAAPATTVAKATPVPAKSGPPPLPSVGVIKFDDLGRAIGRTVMVRTSYGTIRTGKVLTFNKVAFTLETQEHGQSLPLVVPRNNVKSIELVSPE